MNVRRVSVRFWRFPENDNLWQISANYYCELLRRRKVFNCVCVFGVWIKMFLVIFQVRKVEATC